MKRTFTLFLALLMALCLCACGGGDNAPQETDQPDTPAPTEKTVSQEQVIPGAYESVSLFLNSTYQLNENGSYERTSPDEKGTYTVLDNGGFELKEKDMGNGDVFTPHGEYFYRSNLICSFEEDEEYGLAPTFDENGRSNQTFEAYYEPTDTGNQRFVSFAMKEDGAFVLKNQIRNLNGFLTVVDEGDTYEGEYALDGDMLILKWNGLEVPFLFLDGQIYFDVIEKQTAETAAATEARRAALQTARDAKYTPVDDVLSSKVSDAVQGEWGYSANNVDYTLLFDGYDINVTASAGGSSIENKGTYVVCKDFLLITYETGKRALLDYSYEGEEFAFTGSGLHGVDE